MKPILEAINLREFVPILTLIYLLEIVGRQMAAARQEYYRWAARGAGVALVLYAIAGLASWPPTCAWDVVAIVVRAMLASGLVYGIAKIVISAFGFLYDLIIGNYLRWKAKEREDKHYQLSWKIFDYFKKRDYFMQEQLRLPEPDPPPPPPPNREEIADKAKQRYETKLAIIEKAGLDEDERKAATLKAKQEYLRELDKAV